MKRLVLCLLLLIPAGAASAETAFQFAAPGLRAPDDPHVNGMRFTIFHGVNDRMRGFDFGLLSLSESRQLSGLAMVIGVGKLTGDMDGAAAMNLVNIHGGNDRGFNAAFVNRLNNAEQAANVGFVNIVDQGTMFDLGGLNVSDHSKVQLGFINVTDRITGAQIGFLNIAKNGFLPIFPFFNFSTD